MGLIPEVSWRGVPGEAGAVGPGSAHPVLASQGRADKGDFKVSQEWGP